MAKISDKEYKHFSEQLAQRFELNVKGFDIPTTLQDTPCSVKLIHLQSAADVEKVQKSAIKDNEIYFYAKNQKRAVYHLLRHLRNCASHKDRITKKTKNGSSYYHFEDKTKSYVSLRGNVSEAIWDGFIEELYTTVLNDRAKWKGGKTGL